MIEIKNLKLSWEIQASGTTDPVASKTDWDPLNSGGANFKTEVMSENGDEIVIKPTRHNMALSLFFPIMCFMMLIMCTTLGLLNKEILATLFIIAFIGSITCLFYVLLLTGIKKTIINKKSGFYHQKRIFKTLLNKDSDRHGGLENIHAIQLLQQRFSTTSSNGNHRSYKSYELNLIFKDGSRLNLMDHGKLADIEISARKLAKLFNIQIWKAIY